MRSAHAVASACRRRSWLTSFGLSWRWHTQGGRDAGDRRCRGGSRCGDEVAGAAPVGEKLAGVFEAVRQGGAAGRSQYGGFALARSREAGQEDIGPGVEVVTEADSGIGYMKAERMHVADKAKHPVDTGAVSAGSALVLGTATVARENQGAPGSERTGRWWPVCTDKPQRGRRRWVTSAGTRVH